MTRTELARWRLRSQHLTHSTLTRVEQLVEHLLAVQAQDTSGSLWAVGTRLPGSTEAEVEAAIAAGDIVKTWPMRGTLHFVAAADVHWLLELTGQRALKGAQSRLTNLGLDDAALTRARRALVPLLSKGPLTRSEVYAALEQLGFKTDDNRGLHVLFALAHQGVLCWGPRAGKQPTFVLLEAWVKTASKQRARDEALAELARRYVRGHGPTTMADFRWWSGLTAADAQRGFEAVRSEFEVFSFDEREYFAHGTPPSKAAGLQLVPAFDELIVGYTERSLLGMPDDLARMTHGAILGPAVLDDGQVVGRWTRTSHKHGVEVDPGWFRSPSPALAKAFKQAVERYQTFLK